jgi:hypothetical protein
MSPRTLTVELDLNSEAALVALGGAGFSEQDAIRSALVAYAAYVARVDDARDDAAAESDSPLRRGGLA